jgi:hypothetical protein
LLTWARFEGGAFHAELLEDTPGQFTIWHLRAADVDADGRPEVVAVGESYVRVYRRSGDTWRGLTVAPAAADVLVADLDGRPGDELVVLAQGRTELVSLRDARW